MYTKSLDFEQLLTSNTPSLNTMSQLCTVFILSFILNYQLHDNVLPPQKKKTQIESTKDKNVQPAKTRVRDFKKMYTKSCDSE